MFSIFKSDPKVVKINSQEITVKPKETILNAALRNGLSFPYSCKVGGCAACKCELTKGKVKEFTDASYLLSAEELQAGYILACQSVPKSADVVVEVDFSRATNRQIRGKIISQKKLTHDITTLEISLSETPVYKAGQYATLTLERLNDVSRAYSYASMPHEDQTNVNFFIRHVPDGKFSTLVNEQDLVGEGVVVDSPMGDFYLRDSTKPILLIAGGSGLAPIMAVLEKALKDQCTRGVTVLFGARTQSDLYCSQEINDIAAQWKGTFEFEQILSDEPKDSLWSGPRGYIGEYLHTFAKKDQQAYLCGPPLMIDSCIEVLDTVGINKNDIFADRFTSVNSNINSTSE